MKLLIWPVFSLILFFLLVCNAYNPNKCDAAPSRTGPCKAFFQMWRFVKVTSKCELFIYGGCKATRNIFESEYECMATCLA